MFPTKYEELCAALEQQEKIKANFKKLFIEKFSDFMGSQDHCTSISMNQTATTLNPITYNAELDFKVESDLGDRLIHVSGISFKHHPDKSPNYQDVASYKGVEVNLAQNATPMFFAVLKELQRTLIH